MRKSQLLLVSWFLLVILILTMYLYPLIDHPTEFHNTTLTLNPSESTTYHVDRENTILKYHDISFMYFLTDVGSNYSLRFFSQSGSELRTYLLTKDTYFFYDEDFFLQNTFSVLITNLNSTTQLELTIRIGIFSKHTGLSLLGLLILLFMSYYFMVLKHGWGRVLRPGEKFSTIINTIGYLCQFTMLFIFVFLCFIATLTVVH